MLDTESFETTFGPKSQRKKPRLVAADIEVSASHEYFLITRFLLQSLAKTVGESSSKWYLFPDVCAHSCVQCVCLGSYVVEKDRDIVCEDPDYK